jgi:hypothetical protein
MKTYGWAEVQLYAFYLSPGEESGESHAPAPLISGKELGIYCIGGCVGHGADFGTLKERKILVPLRTEARSSSP